MKKLLVLFLCILSSTGMIAQKSSYNLTYTAVYNGVYTLLDSIEIINASQNCDTVLYWPDTVLSFTLTGKSDLTGSIDPFKVYQNYPNPITDVATIRMRVPLRDEITIRISDLCGKCLLQKSFILDAGLHSFRFSPGNQKCYILTTEWRDKLERIKIVNLNNGQVFPEMEYISGIDLAQSHRSKITRDFSLYPGDTLYQIGYGPNNSQINGSDILMYVVEGSDTLVFTILEGLPCPETPFVNYSGQIYTTVQIGSQCWFKENLNVGAMIPGNQNQTNNGVIEKYCYQNNPGNCSIYGGLYQWNELMGYVTQEGAQGICPSGWHVATDAEWVSAFDFLGGISVASGKMKTTGTIEQGTGLWYSPNEGATNESGFSVIPGGSSGWSTIVFNALGWDAYYHSSTQSNADYSWQYDFVGMDVAVWRYDYKKTDGNSVRCLKN